MHACPFSHMYVHVSAEAVHDSAYLCLFLCRGDILKQNWRNNLYKLVPLEKTDSTTGIGFLGVKEDFSSKVQIPQSGGTTALRKR